MTAGEFLAAMLRQAVTPTGALTVASVGAAAVIGHLWARYLNRMAVLRWSVAHKSIATTIQAPAFGKVPYFGKVEVTFDGASVRHLFRCELELENESSRDLTNMPVDLWYEDGTLIVGHQGNVIGSAQEMPWSQRYQAAIDRFNSATAENPAAEDDVQYLYRGRSFIIPVLNRRGRAIFVFLLSAQSDAAPTLMIACDHPGIAVKHETKTQEFWGIHAGRALVAGALVAAIVAMLFAAYVRWPVLAAFVGVLLGTFAIVLGAALIRAKRMLQRLIG